jgi:hypothetical protein
VGNQLLKILDNKNGFELAECIETKINKILRTIQVENLVQSIKGEETCNIQTLFNLLTQIAHDLDIVIGHELVDFVVTKFKEQKIHSNRLNTFKTVTKESLIKMGIEEQYVIRIMKVICCYNDY